jgi:hypothetical protein
VRQQGWRFALWSALGGLVPAAASLAAFGPSFLGTLAARGVQNSIRGAEHASPWVLLPLAGDAYVIAKTLVAALFCALLLGLLAKRRIDVLNFCAGITVTFVCLWLDKGAMNRMNIAIIFAVATLASRSRFGSRTFQVSPRSAMPTPSLLGIAPTRKRSMRCWCWCSWWPIWLSWYASALRNLSRLAGPVGRAPDRGTGRAPDEDAPQRRAGRPAGPAGTQSGKLS